MKINSLACLTSEQKYTCISITSVREKPFILGSPCVSIPLGLMDYLPDFEDLPLMPPMDSDRYSGKLSLVGLGGDSGMGGGAKFTSRRI